MVEYSAIVDSLSRWLIFTNVVFSLFSEYPRLEFCAIGLADSAIACRSVEIMADGIGYTRCRIRYFPRRYSHFGSLLLLFIAPWLGLIPPLSGLIDVGSPPAIRSFGRSNSLLSIWCISRLARRLLVCDFWEVGPSLSLRSGVALAHLYMYLDWRDRAHFCRYLL